ncbi:hypothetical protein Tco_0730165 [Tanacetum coccineum]|uniref:Uncharacterized protein n=1 Tax=Tanacetum coccineum TaxID=301880 RepID=A0ABQ4YR06_9ASTR
MSSLRKMLNSDSNGLSYTGVENTANDQKGHRLGANTKNDRGPSAYKSSCNRIKKLKALCYSKIMFVKILGSVVHKKVIWLFHCYFCDSVLTEFTTEDKELSLETMNVTLMSSHIMYDDYLVVTVICSKNCFVSGQATSRCYELETQQHVQHQPATIADNVPNAMFDENTFVNPFATPSTSDAESSSSQYVEFYRHASVLQPLPYGISMD